MRINLRKNPYYYNSVVKIQLLTHWLSYIQFALENISQRQTFDITGSDNRKRERKKEDKKDREK